MIPPKSRPCAAMSAEEGGDVEHLVAGALGERLDLRVVLGAAGLQERDLARVEEARDPRGADEGRVVRERVVAHRERGGDGAGDSVAGLHQAAERERHDGAGRYRAGRDAGGTARRSEDVDRGARRRVDADDRLDGREEREARDVRDRRRDSLSGAALGRLHRVDDRLVRGRVGLLRDQRDAVDDRARRRRAEELVAEDADREERRLERSGLLEDRGPAAPEDDVDQGVLARNGARVGDAIHDAGPEVARDGQIVVGPGEGQVLGLAGVRRVAERRRQAREDLAGPEARLADDRLLEAGDARLAGEDRGPGIRLPVLDPAAVDESRVDGGADGDELGEISLGRGRGGRDREGEREGDEEGGSSWLFIGHLLRRTSGG